MRFSVPALLLVGLLSAGTAAAADLLPKPLKMSPDQAAGPVFEGPSVKHDNTHGASSNAELLISRDRKFSAGLFKAGKGDFSFDAYPGDEFCYFLSGSVKLTSADGTFIELKAGDAVVIPKGWKGRWTTSGYSKYYVVYDADQ